MPGEDHAQDDQHADEIGRRYLIRFDKDTLRSRPLWIRVIIEFAGTFLPRHCGRRGRSDQSLCGRAPGQPGRRCDRPRRAGHGADLRLGPPVRLHINPAVTLAFLGRRVFPLSWVIPYWAAQFAGAITAALVLQVLFGHVGAGGYLPDCPPGRRLAGFRDGNRAHCHPGQRDPQHRDRAPEHRPQRGDRGRGDGRPARLVRQPGQRSIDEPARTLGPDVVGLNVTGWWVYLLGDAVGAVLAVMLIGLVRGLPDRAEREAAEGSPLSG